MVKKITGKPPKPAIRTDSVQSAKTVGSTKIDKVGATAQKGASTKVDAAGRRINRQNHDELLKLIEEEADKLFAQSGLPENKKETIKGAVRMVLEASMTEGAEEE